MCVRTPLAAAIFLILERVRAARRHRDEFAWPFPRMYELLRSRRQPSSPELYIRQGVMQEFPAEEITLHVVALG